MNRNAIVLTAGALLVLLAAACSGGSKHEGDADLDAEGADAPDRLEALTCEGVTCSGHGRCEMDAYGPVCVCDTGYAGVECAACAEGYAFDPYGACRPVCGLDCGAHGTCVTVDATDLCSCQAGWTGVWCETYTGSRLEIWALDIWGRALDGSSSTLTITSNGAAVAPAFPVTRLEPGEAGTVSVHLETATFHPLEITLGYDGTNSASAWTVTGFADEAGHALSVSRDLVDGNWTAAFYLGQRSMWFSAAGPPARKGNQITFLMDGQEAWMAVEGALRAAYATVNIATWWWESDFELVRGDTPGDIYATEDERRALTMMAVLDASPGVFKRVLVNQFVSQDGILEDFNVDDALLEKGAQPVDNFEFMGQANPSAGMFDFQVETFYFSDRVRGAWPETGARTFDAEGPVASPVPGHVVDITLPLGIEGLSVASWHQKFIVIDGLRAFVGGMNVKASDWDTSEHLVYDPRRMTFESTVEDREAVLSRAAEPDTGPRKDMMMMIDGPIVEDAAEVFKARWDVAMSEGVRFSENSTAFDILTDLPEHGDGVEAQLTVTMPQPFWRHGIAETWLSAILSATSYIYIEDQYFRAPMLNPAIIERMEAMPQLLLIVVTKPVSEWTDPGCYWTHLASRELAERFPGRYVLYQLRSFDYVDVGWGIDETECRFTDMDTHTKILMVDDVFMSVGSCNHNNRGLVYEGEMNVAVLDAPFVREARRRIFQNILSFFYTDANDAAVVLDEFAQAAAWNQYVRDNWAAQGDDISLDGAPLPEAYMPYGFLYPLAFAAPEDCLIEGVSEDLTVM
jgi:phosphatidylserine/phosphatidylglycerophosphate/cardiolipin synthase-like enzyme